MRSTESFEPFKTQTAVRLCLLGLMCTCLTSVLFAATQDPVVTPGSKYYLQFTTTTEGEDHTINIHKKTDEPVGPDISSSTIDAQDADGAQWDAFGQQTPQLHAYKIINPGIGNSIWVAISGKFVTGGGGGGGGEPPKFNVNVVEVEQSADLWWFNGQNPGGGYSVQATLTAQGLSTGTFKWDVTAGTTKVNLNNGGEDSDSITATNDNTVTIKSTAASASATQVTKDITIRFTHNGTVVSDFDTVVFAPDHFIHLSNTDYTYATTSFRSVIAYRLEDQFNQVLPHTVPLNEDVDGNGTYSSAATNTAAATSDWTIANGKPEDENWGWAADVGGDIPPAYATDTIQRAVPDGIAPTPQTPQTPLGTDKIDHLTGSLYIGSATTGSGVKVKDLKWQIYRDHARHE